MLMDGTPLFIDSALSPCTFSRVNIYTHTDSIVSLAVLLSSTFAHFKDFDNLMCIFYDLIWSDKETCVLVCVKEGGCRLCHLCTGWWVLWVCLWHLLRTLRVTQHLVASLLEAQLTSVRTTDITQHGLGCQSREIKHFYCVYHKN